MSEGQQVQTQESAGPRRKRGPFRRMGRIMGTLTLAGVFSAFLSVAWVIYPGVFEWTAPVLCPEGQPDPAVVQYTVTHRDGTATNFTLFCMSERGEFTEVGSWRPLGIVTACTFGALLVIALVLKILALARRGTRAPDPTAPADLSGSLPSGPIS